MMADAELPSMDNNSAASTIEGGIESLRLRALASVKSGRKMVGDREEGELSDTEAPSLEITSPVHATAPPPLSPFSKKRHAYINDIKKSWHKSIQSGGKRRRVFKNIKEPNKFMTKYSKSLQPGTVSTAKPEFLVTIDSEDDEEVIVEPVESVPPEKLLLIKAKESYSKLQAELKDLESKKEANRRLLTDTETRVLTLNAKLKKAGTRVKSHQLTEKVLDADIQIKRRSALYLSRDIKKYENAINEFSPPASPKKSDLADLEIQAEKARQELASLKLEILKKKALQKANRVEKLGTNSSVKALGKIMALSSHFMKDKLEEDNNAPTTAIEPLDLTRYFPEQLYQMGDTLCSVDILEKVSNVFANVCSESSIENFKDEDYIIEQPLSRSSNIVKFDAWPIPKQFQPYQSPLRAFKSYRFSPYFGYSAPNGGLLSKTFTNKVRHYIPFCPHDLISGSCKKKACSLQHVSSISMSDSVIMNDFACQLQVYEAKDPFRDSNHLLTFLKQKLLLMIKQEHSIVVLVGVILDIFKQMGYGNNVIQLKPLRGASENSNFINKMLEKTDGLNTDLTSPTRILLSGMADLAKGIVPRVPRYFDPAEVDQHIENIISSSSNESRWVEVLLLKLSSLGKTDSNSLGDLLVFLEKTYQVHSESEILPILIEDLRTLKGQPTAIACESDLLAYRALVEALNCCENSKDVSLVIKSASGVNIVMSCFDAICASVKTLCLLGDTEGSLYILEQILADDSSLIPSSCLSTDELFSLTVLFSFIRIESCLPSYLFCAFPFDYLPRRNFFYRLPLHKASSATLQEITLLFNTFTEKSNLLSQSFHEYFMYILNDLRVSNEAKEVFGISKCSSVPNSTLSLLLNLEGKDYQDMKECIRSYWHSVLRISKRKDEDLAAMIARIFGISNILGIVKTVEVAPHCDFKGRNNVFDWILALISLVILYSDCSVNDVELLIENAITQNPNNITSTFLLFCLGRVKEDQESVIYRMLSQKEDYPQTSLSLFRLNNEGEEEDYVQQFTLLNLQPTEDVSELACHFIFKHLSSFVYLLKPSTFSARHFPLSLKDILALIERDPFNIALWSMAWNAISDLTSRTKIVTQVRKLIGTKDKQPVAGALRKMFEITES